MKSGDDGADSGHRAGFGFEMLADASALTGSEFAYRQLFDAILAQRLLPGARLREVTLAELFGVGRSAVRESLQHLERVGLVESRPHRGAQVARPAADEVAGIIDARRVIECALLERTVERLGSGAIDAAALDTIRELAHEEGEHLRAGRRGAALRLGCEQHLALAGLADHRSLSACLERLVPETALAITAYEHAAHEPNGWRGRLGVLDAVASGEPRTAVRAMREHLDALEASLDTRVRPAGDPLDHAFPDLPTRAAT